MKNGPALGGYGAVAMNKALAASMTTLPAQLRKTLTWDSQNVMASYRGCRELNTNRRAMISGDKSPRVA